MISIRPSAKAQAVLDSVSYITIATVGEDGQPWNTPVAAFHFDGGYTFYWASWQDNQHSQNIRANGKAKPFMQWGHNNFAEASDIFNINYFKAPDL